MVGVEKHFGVYVKREGIVATGSTWAGAKVQEVGIHDVFPRFRLLPRGGGCPSAWRFYLSSRNVSSS